MATTWTATIIKKTTFGDQQMVYATLTTTSSGNTYTTGGDSFQPASVGLAYFDYTDLGFALASGRATSYAAQLFLGTGGENAVANLQLFWTGAALSGPFAEVTSASATNSLTITAEFRGV